MCPASLSSLTQHELPAFAAVHRAEAPLLLRAGAVLSINIFFQRGAQQQTRRTPLLLWNDGTDRRTYRRTLDRFTYSALHTLRAVSVGDVGPYTSAFVTWRRACTTSTEDCFETAQILL